MFERILVPLDGSLPATAALSVGAQMARRLGVDLHALALVEPGRDEAHVRKLIEHQANRVDGQPELHIRPLSYSVPDDIAAEFDAVDETLIVMQTWARGRSAGLLHNVSEDVLRMVRTPMVVVGPRVAPDPDWTEKPLLVSTDGSHFGDQIVPSAARLARALRIEAELVTVIDQAAVPAGYGVAGESNSLTGLASDMESITGRPINYDTLHGAEPADALVDHARRRRASFIALSTHGRSGVARITADSVAMDVVRHADCPVLLHRPAIDD
jgi:nucleotide-binding universal stress UspA family protein